jgi:hypothetical protein
MPVWAWILIGVGAALAVAAVAVAVFVRRRTGQLRERFGPAYDRTVEERGNRRRAEAELAERERMHDELTLTPLTSAARSRYLDAWRAVQSRFVDQPDVTVRDADLLVTAVMMDRGYPMDDFEAQAAVVSVDHPAVVESYRAAHATAEASEHGEASTEDLREAIRNYRALFEELLEDAADEPIGAERAYAHAQTNVCAADKPFGPVRA